MDGGVEEEIGGSKIRVEIVDDLECRGTLNSEAMSHVKPPPLSLH